MRIQFCTRTRFARHAAAIDGIHEATGGAPPGAALGEIGRRVAHPQFRGAIAWHGRQIDAPMSVNGSDDVWVFNF